MKESDFFMPPENPPENTPDIPERIPKTPENPLNAQERIPSMAEVGEMLKGFSGMEAFVPDKLIEDDKGLCILRFSVADGPEGATAEYDYMRQGRHGEKDAALVSMINITYYDKDGLPFCGDTLANLVDGEWKITDEGAKKILFIKPEGEKTDDDLINSMKALRNY
jgi:hypothetical protein